MEVNRFFVSLIPTCWYASVDKKLDTDDPEHIGWLYKIAAARAAEFNIEGVTWSLTQGVVKNIIPAIASTNAIIAGSSFLYLMSGNMNNTNIVYAAACCNEAFKIATSSAAFLDNYFMLIGTDGVYSYTFTHKKRDDCPVCGGEALEMTISSDMTVEELIETLTEKQDMCVLITTKCLINAHKVMFHSQIKKPSLSTSAPTKQIYLQAPPQLEKATRPNLEKKVKEFVQEGGEITVTASTLPFNLSLRISYSVPA